MIAAAPTARDTRGWQPVALSSQVPEGKPVRVACAHEDLVLFRDAAGTCRALADRCAHRRAPLSQGRLTEDFLIECPYHGWRYSASGACAAIPNLRADEAIPKNYRVRSYDTAERDGFVQVLFGEAGTTSHPLDTELPDLGRQWQGERLLAYPDEWLMDTLVDCPSALVSIEGIEILDDHPFGDPAVRGGQLSVEYAGAKARRTPHPRKTQAADFAYTIRISASRTIAQISLFANGDARLLATALLVGVGGGRRITRALWRGSGLPDSHREITVRPHVHAHAVGASRNFASQCWSGATSLTEA